MHTTAGRWHKHFGKWATNKYFLFRHGPSDTLATRWGIAGAL
jgi:hypothetical protein